MKPRAIIVMGPPASGKGTLARKLAEHFSFTHLESGKLIKHYFQTFPSDPKVMEAKKVYDSGGIVSSETFYGWLESRVRELASQNFGIVFDGAPRAFFEAVKLISLLEELFGWSNIHAFYLDVSQDTLIKRATSRRVCDVCGASASITPESGNSCPQPNCQGKLVAKPIDALIEKRLEVFEKEVRPAFNYVNQMGYVKIINGEPSVDIVLKEILKTLPT